MVYVNKRHLGSLRAIITSNRSIMQASLTTSDNSYCYLGVGSHCGGLALLALRTLQNRPPVLPKARIGLSQSLFKTLISQSFVTRLCNHAGLLAASPGRDREGLSRYARSRPGVGAVYTSLSFIGVYILMCSILLSRRCSVLMEASVCSQCFRYLASTPVISGEGPFGRPSTYSLIDRNSIGKSHYT